MCIEKVKWKANDTARMRYAGALKIGKREMNLIVDKESNGGITEIIAHLDSAHQIGLFKTSEQKANDN